jgi:hypothetical protein
MYHSSTYHHSYTGDGSVCWQQCPPNLPNKCGRICTADEKSCSIEVLKASLSGFAVVYGIGALGGALIAGVGAAGIAALASAFGVLSGVGNIGAGTFGTILQISKYPFCPGSIDDQDKVRKSVDGAVRSFKTHLENSYNPRH